MKDLEINPLNLAGRRKLNFLPPHFKTVEIKEFISPQVDNWIVENLKGRYFRGKTTKLLDNKIVDVYVVAFEDPKEATFFLLNNSGQK
jgi:hypothetical protein